MDRQTKRQGCSRPRDVIGLEAGWCPPLFLLLAALGIVGCVATTGLTDHEEPPSPAKPMEGRLTIDQPETGQVTMLPLGTGDIPFPLGARQLDEKYWLGAMIGPNDIPALKRMGIRIVLSAVEPEDKTLYLLSTSGIEHVSVPMGSTFRYAERILEVTDHHRPSEIYIHCTHGADRTGAIAAYILVMRHKWPIADAFYSVLCPCPEDIEGLQRVLRGFCIDDRRTPDDPSVGIYSLASLGQEGGLKVRSRRYRRLVRTTLEQMITPVTNGLCPQR